MVIERDKLDSDIATLAAAHSGNQAAFRKAAVERSQEALTEGRAPGRRPLPAAAASVDERQCLKV
jgi:hypothetical protein